MEVRRSRGKLLATVSALALIVGLERTAAATCVTNPTLPYTNSGALTCVNFNATPAGAGDVTNNGTITAALYPPPSETGISATNYSSLNGSIVNNGTIISPSSRGILVLNASVADSITNTTAGTIKSLFTDMYLLNGTVAGSITNNGTLTSSIDGVDVAEATVGESVINAGRILVTGSTPISSPSYGIAVSGNSTVTGSIVNTELISVTGPTSFAFGIAVNDDSAVTGIGNSGTIIVNGASGANIGIGVTSSTVKPESILGGEAIINTGSITAGTGIALNKGAIVLGDIVNTGSILANSNGIVLSGSSRVGSIVNATNATITAQAAGILVTNPVTAYGTAIASSVSGSIANQGTIAAVTGIKVVGASTIGGSLSNSGLIAAGTGIRVVGASMIGGTLSNSGTIAAAYNGIALIASNSSGVVLRPSVAGGISNSGTITSGISGLGGLAAIGLYGASVGGGITNTSSGTITTQTAGIRVGYAILSRTDIGSSVAGGITNQGSITVKGATGTGIAIQLSTVAGNITNSGTITINGTAGANIGVALTASTLQPGGGTGAIVNSGSITARTGIALSDGAIVPGGITNSGNITSTRAAIDLATLYGGEGAATTINQQGGTITGNILFSAKGDTLNVTGGAIAGNIVGNSVANGANAGTVNFALGAGTFTTGGSIDVANINVNTGTLLLANDVTVANAFTNRAILQLNNTGLRTITGNFSQAAGGTLVMEVSPTGSAQLNVTKSATLASTLALVYEPGVYTARYYTLISAAGVSGQFTGAFYSGTSPGLAQSIGYNPTTVQLCLGEVGCTQSVIQVPGPPPPHAPLIVGPTNDAAYSALTNTLVQGGQQANNWLLNQIGSHFGANDAGSFGANFAPPPGMQMQLAQLGSGSNLAAISEIAEALPQAVADQGGWFRGIGSFGSVNGSSVAPGFTADSGGFMAGVDRPVLPDVFAGLAAGYTHSNVQEHSTSSGNIDTGRVMAYGGGLVGTAWWSASAGYAHDGISTARGIAGIGTASEKHGGNEFTLAGQWSLPFQVQGFGGSATTLTPKAGLQFLHLAEGGFTESGASGFDLSSGSNSTDSLQPFIGVTASQTFITDGGMRITPELRLGYSHELANVSGVLNVSTITGATFLAQGIRPSRDMLTAGVGGTMRAQDNVYLYASYDTILRTGNTAEQTISAGMRIRF